MMSRSIVWLVLASVACGVTGATAQEELAPDGSVIRHTKLERSCAIALDRFCPELAQTPGQTRNQVICLKPYRMSLPPYCRAAVNAAMK